MDSNFTPSCPCLSPDAARARAAKRLLTGDHLIDESHLIVGIQRCVLCGQAFLSIFTELIDWQGGDDSQARVLVPVTPEEVGMFAARPDVTEDDILEMNFIRRMLWWVHPRDSAPSAYWSDGPLTILPHD